MIQVNFQDTTTKAEPAGRPISPEVRMDFRNLEYFMTVAQELNFTRAAEKLSMSQPPLSMQIKALEDELGTELFIRGKRRLTLTEAGIILYRRAAQIMDLADRTRSEITSLRNDLAGSISLGLVEGRGPYIAAAWVSGFRKEYPNVTFRITNGSSDDIIYRMSRGFVDVAVIGAPYDREHLDGVPVARDPWMALMSSGHPLAKKEGNTIPLRDLVGEPLIIPDRASRVASIRRWFASIGAEPTILANTPNYLNVLALTEQNAGIAIYPYTTAAPNPRITEKKITDPEKAMEYVLVRKRNEKCTQVTEEFINYVKDILEEERMHPAGDDDSAMSFRVPDEVEVL